MVQDISFFPHHYDGEGYRTDISLNLAVQRTHLYFEIYLKIYYILFQLGFLTKIFKEHSFCPTHKF